MFSHSSYDFEALLIPERAAKRIRPESERMGDPMAKILIVDDEPIIRLSLQKLLPFLGHEVAGIAASGIEAVECAKILAPDIILMDIVMPGEMDGIAAARIIRMELDIPVIFLTGYADETFLNRAKCAEPYGYLVKSAGEETLKAAIEMALHKKNLNKRTQDASAHYSDITHHLTSHFFWISAGDFSHIDYAGPSYERIFGRTLTDLYLDPSDVFAVIHPDDCPCILESIKTLQSGRMSEIFFRIILPDESTRWIRNCAFPVKDNGTVSRIVGISEDFTTHKLMEEALRRSEEKYRTVADFTYDWEFWIGPDGHYIYISPACERITGYPAASFLNDPKLLEQITHPDDREVIINHRHSTPEDSDIIPFDFRILTSQNEERWIEHRCQAVFDSHGEWQGWRGSNRDITDHKKMEEQRMVIEKLESTSTLAAGIAHDFNNLLAAIVGNLDLAKLYLTPGSEALRHVGIAEEASWKAQALTQQLLSFAKGRSPATRVISLPHVLEEQTNRALDGSSIEAVFSFPADLWIVEADENQLGQAIRNIICNAREAMMGNGKLMVSVENVIIPPLSGIAITAGHYVKISIADQGSGIRDDLLPKIFDPYFSTKQLGETKGMGLGLTICRSIVAQHGGTITVDTEQQEGTTFHIYLPASGPPALEKHAASPSMSSRQGGKLLVMDDEDIMRNLFSKSLQQAGYNVWTVGKGEDAVERYIQAKALGRPFDAVILDLTIRTGLGALETLKILKNIDYNIKAVVTSGYAKDTVIIGFEQYGFRGALIKPFRLSELNDLIDDILKS